jgi:hypothetical protein
MSSNNNNIINTHKGELWCKYNQVDNKNVCLDIISLSYDDSEQLAYKEFMNKFPNMYNFNVTTVKNENIDLIDDDVDYLTNLKNEIEIARQHSEKEEAQYDKYYLLKWKYDLLCKEYNKYK